MHIKIIKSILEYISFLYSIFSCFKIFFILRKKKIDVFLSPEGGFGPTILKPIMLSCFYKKQSNFILIFGFHPKRHNKLISKLFEKNFLWLELSNRKIPYAPISEKKKYFIFNFLEFLLNKFSKVKKVTDFNKFFCNYLNVENIPEQSDTSFGTYRSVHKFINKNEKFINFNNTYLDNLKKMINFKLNDKKCSLYIRRNDIISDSTKELRNTDTLNSYKESIIENLKQGWQFFISGDEIKIEDWMYDFQDSIIFRSKTKFQIDQYNLFCGLISDCFISSGSGPTNWKFLDTNKPFLVLDGYPIGMGWYKSTVAYKLIKKKNFKNVNEIFDDKSMRYNPPIDCNFLNSKEKKKIINEFLNFQKYGYVVGLSGQVLNLPENSILNCGYAKVSQNWLEIQKNILEN